VDARVMRLFDFKMMFVATLLVIPLLFLIRTGPNTVTADTSHAAMDQARPSPFRPGA